MGIGDSLRVPETIRKGGRGKALALVPVLVAIVFSALLLPRAAPPDLVPLPIVDRRAFEAQVAADRALAESAKRDGLPDDVRILGEAIRESHRLEHADAPAQEIYQAKRKLEGALQTAYASAGEDAIVKLRAFQLEAFLDEAKKFEKSGEETPDFVALAGSLRLLRREGWLKDHAFVLDARELRVAYKLAWNAWVGVEGRDAFKPTLDEMRAIYSFQLTHPHVTSKQREALAAQRAAAKDAKACEIIDAGERIALETWRLERIKKLATIDPEYPADYARGVAEYRRGFYGAAADAFRDWLREHPNGPWSLRAQNHLKAAIDAERGGP